MNARRVAALLGMAVGALVWFALPQARGAEALSVTIDQVGWWTSRVGASEAPDGGFEVSATPTGERQSVAAVQFTIQASEVSTFSLTLVESSALAEFSTIRVCQTDGFTSENPGALEDAPTEDCTDSVSLTQSADDGVWLGDVARLVSDGGIVSLMFIPVHEPPLPIGPGMVVTVAEVQVEATGSTAPTDSRSSSTPTPTTAVEQVDDETAFPPSPAGPSTGFNPPSPVPVESSPDVELPTSNFTPETEPAVPDDVVEPPGDDEFFALDPVAAEPAPGKPWIRLVILVPLSAAIGYAAVLLRNFYLGRAEATGAAPAAP